MTVPPIKAAVYGLGDDVSRIVTWTLNAVAPENDDPLPAGLDGVVIVGERPTPHELARLDTQSWRRLAHEPLWRVTSILQRAWESMADHGGRIVVIVPTVGISGAANLVPYVTALEGIRAMVKSAARQWAARGVIVNTVGVPLALLAPEVADAAHHLTAPAVFDRDGLLDDIAETATFLLRDNVANVVGQTIVVDGGSVMLP